VEVGELPLVDHLVEQLEVFETLVVFQQVQMLLEMVKDPLEEGLI
jgi:hypothetical protein